MFGSGSGFGFDVWVSLGFPHWLYKMVVFKSMNDISQKFLEPVHSDQDSPSSAKIA